jgi:hypothetical protein
MLSSRRSTIIGTFRRVNLSDKRRIVDLAENGLPVSRLITASTRRADPLGFRARLCSRLGRTVLKCFVIMPFARNFDDVYATIRASVESTAVSGLGLTILRGGPARGCRLLPECEAQAASARIIECRRSLGSCMPGPAPSKLRSAERCQLGFHRSRGSVFPIKCAYNALTA